MQRYLCLPMVLLIVVLATLPGLAEEVLDPRQQALQQLVYGYVRSEKKASYESVLEQVKLIVGDDDQLFSPSLMEKVVRDAMDDTHVYADRLVLDMLDTVSDPDCMEREFDAADDNDDFNATEAARVLHKCKLLVLRNVFTQEFLSEYKTNFTGFIQGIKNGKIPRGGTTTNNEGYYQHRLDHGRWEVLLPPNLARREIIANYQILSVLMQDIILGAQLNLHSVGTALADSGAHHQRWHTDADYLFGDTLYPTAGVSQHELPAYAITMMVPMLQMTADHGPTHFAMGSSNLAGMLEDREDIPLRNESLRQYIYDQPKEDEEDDVKEYEYMRTPMLNFGDVLLFDYQIIHRGGKNVSPDLRAMLYLTYSRFWYKDKGFEDEDMEVAEGGVWDWDNQEKRRRLYKQLTQSARFAIPDDFRLEIEEETDVDWREYADDEERSLESMGSFAEEDDNPIDPNLSNDEEL